MAEGIVPQENLTRSRALPAASMKVLSVLTITLFFAARLAADTILLDSNFGPVSDSEEVTGLAGSLPPEWGGDSGTRFSANYTTGQTEEEEEERDFLRVNFKSEGRGPLVLFAEVEEHAAPGFFHLRLSGRTEEEAQLRVGLRTRLPPHTHLGEARLDLGEDWTDHSVEFSSVPVAGERMELFIEIPEGGAVELDYVRLSRRSRDEVLGEVLATHPDGLGGNLVAITRFPLGLQAGMSLAREVCDANEVTVETHNDVTGPSGSPALRIEAARDFHLYLGLFAPAVTFDPHHASIHVRGEGGGRLIVMAGPRRLEEVEFSASPNRWDRVGVAFLPAEGDQPHVLRVEGRGNFWIDALQVAHGMEARPYESRRAAEVALAVPAAGDGAVARVQFEDEEPKIEFAVTGDFAGGTLQARLFDLYGEESEVPSVDLANGFLHRGALSYRPDEGRPLGSFRVEAWVEDGDGDRISPISEIVFHRLRRPHHWEALAPEGFLGIHSGPTRRHLQMAKAVGVNWVRLHDAGLPLVGWHHLERTRANWSFRDAVLRRYRDYGMAILGSLSTAPEWASHLKRFHDPDFDRFYQPANLSRFRTYVAVVTERYRDLIRHWDVWHQPWTPHYWAVDHDPEALEPGYITSQDPAADYVRLKQAAYEAAKAVDEEIRIVGFNTAASPEGEEWTRKVLENGGLEFTDILGYHHHSREPAGFPGDEVEEGFRAIVDTVEPGLQDDPLPPVWLKEGSAGREEIANGLYRHTLLREEADNPLPAADRLQRFVLSARARGAEKIFLHTMHAHHYFGRGGDERLLVTEEGYLHPSGAALSALAWHLEGAEFSNRLEMAPHLHAYLFEKASGSVAVLAARPGENVAYVIPDNEELSAEDLFGNPLDPGSEMGETLVFLSAEIPAGDLEKVLTGPDDR